MLAKGAVELLVVTLVDLNEDTLGDALVDKSVEVEVEVLGITLRKDTWTSTVWQVRGCVWQTARHTGWVKFETLVE